MVDYRSNRTKHLSLNTTIIIMKENVFLDSSIGKKNLKLSELKRKNIAHQQKAIANLEPYVVKFLQSHYRWDHAEAMSIYHDASLLVLDQLKANKIVEINKTYFIKVCKNLGANYYRKVLKERESFCTYWEEFQRQYQEEVKDLYGIEIFDSSEYDDDSKAHIALRAFSLLSEKCQSIIRAKYLDELSHKAIAERSIYVNSANSAKTVLNRCIKYWKKFNKKMNER